MALRMRGVLRIKLKSQFPKQLTNSYRLLPYNIHYSSFSSESATSTPVPKKKYSYFWTIFGISATAIVGFATYSYVSTQNKPKQWTQFDKYTAAMLIDFEYAPLKLAEIALETYLKQSEFRLANWESLPEAESVLFPDLKSKFVAAQGKLAFVKWKIANLDGKAIDEKVRELSERAAEGKDPYGLMVKAQLLRKAAREFDAEGNKSGEAEELREEAKKLEQIAVDVQKERAKVVAEQIAGNKEVKRWISADLSDPRYAVAQNSVVLASILLPEIANVSNPISLQDTIWDIPKFTESADGVPIINALPMLTAAALAGSQMAAQVVFFAHTGQIDVEKYPDYLDPEKVSIFTEAVGLSASIVALGRAADFGNEYAQEMFVTLLALGYAKMTYFGPRFAGITDKIQDMEIGMGDKEQNSDDLTKTIDAEINEKTEELMAEWYGKRLEKEGKSKDQVEKAVKVFLEGIRKPKPVVSKEIKQKMPCVKAWMDLRDNTRA
ncbi:hypothetical protein HK098_004904 [Nowakowskiella sp. JEL0407]|nr:hypothetical protein HK098_004904 [Nowakowskiella sp. JEL0407]